MASSQVPLLRELATVYASHSPVRTVAVVGNAPLSPSVQRAADIDSCDVVFRVNGFALDGIDSRSVVGRRTNVVLFNRALRATPWVFEGYRNRLYLLVEPGRLHWEREYWPRWWPSDLGYVVVSNRDVILPLSRALGLSSRTEPVWATTGTVAVWVARLVFPEAEVLGAGFSFVDAPVQTSWQHSYGEPSPVGPEHVLQAESVMLRSWTEQGGLRLLP